MRVILVALLLFIPSVASSFDSLTIKDSDGISREFRAVVECDELQYGTTTRKRSKDEIRELLEEIMEPDVPETGDFIISHSGLTWYSEGGEDYKEKYAEEFLYETIPLVKDVCTLTWEYVEED